MSTLPIPQGATIGDEPKPVPIPQGATVGDQKPTEEGTLQKFWRVINTPVGDLISGASGSTKRAILQAMGNELGADFSPENLHRVASELDPDHPAKTALKTFLAGAAEDTADTAAGFSSPLSLATMSAGAAAKIPGAAGKVAQAASAIAGAGFSAKGASDVVSAGLENTPEAWKQRLQGGAMAAGGAAGALEGSAPIVGATKKAVLLGKTPEEAYESALKPSTTIPAAQRARIVQTGLQEGIPVSKAGVEFIHDLIDQLNGEVTNTIAKNPGRFIDRSAVASRLNDTANRFSQQVSPTADLEAIQKVGKDFEATNPQQIPADVAQAKKVGTYRVLREKYGEQGSATTEGQKDLARGLKEELANQFPELNNLNAREGSLIQLNKVIERAVNRIGNHQLVGIGTPVMGAGVKAVTGSAKLAGAAAVIKAVLDNPAVKSRLAIALQAANKGKGLTNAQAASRIASYSNALAAASSSSAEAGNGQNEQ